MTTALYRRYRPDTFQEVVGQEHVTEPLMAALRTGRITHAYLFSGPRGCGKTTSARILARCLNCAQGPTDTPCGECDSCVELARGGPGSLDVVEIDAASHNGVDDARELRERASYAPVRDRYKVFILDEAHMVTPQGFNALLKLVEEPPEHVKFVFATTEPEKVIGTIRSRTHHYPFRLVGPRVLTGYLGSLAQAEGVEVAEGVLPMVVRAGGGSVRDSLSVLDQLVAGSSGGTLALDRASALLGFTDSALLDSVVDALADRDGAALFDVVDDVVATGHDPRRFVEDLLERLRDLVVLSVAGEQAETVLRGVPQDQLTRMQEQAQRMGPARLSRSADLTNAALSEMTGATSPRLHLELLCARILLPGVGDAEAGILARVETVEQALASGAVPPHDAGASLPQSSRAGGSAPSDRRTPDGGRPSDGSSPDGRPTAGPGGPGGATGAEASSEHGGAPAGGPAPAEPSRAREGIGANAGGGAATPGRGTSEPQAAAPAAPDWRDLLSPPGASRPAPDSAPAAEQPVPSTQEPAPARPDPSAPEQQTASAPRQVPEQSAPPAREEEPASVPGPAPGPNTDQAGGRPAPGTSATAGAPAPAEATPPDAGGADGIGPDAVAGRWSEVVDVLAGLRRASWALVSQNAVVGGVTADEVRLDFPSAGLADAFRNGGHAEPVEEALRRTFGVRLRATAGIAGAAPAPGGGAGGQGAGARGRSPRPERPVGSRGNGSDDDPGHRRPQDVPTDAPVAAPGVPLTPEGEPAADPDGGPSSDAHAEPNADGGASTDAHAEPNADDDRVADPTADPTAGPAPAAPARPDPAPAAARAPEPAPVGPDGWPAVAVPGRALRAAAAEDPGPGAPSVAAGSVAPDPAAIPGATVPAAPAPATTSAVPPADPASTVTSTGPVAAPSPDEDDLADLPGPDITTEDGWSEPAGDRAPVDEAVDESSVVGPDHGADTEVSGAVAPNDDYPPPDDRYAPEDDGAEAPVVLPGQRPLDGTPDPHPAGPGQPQSPGGFGVPRVDPADDQPSPDDEDAEQSGLMGVDLLISAFGARILEKRSPSSDVPPGT
ncbi:DNA polymerase III subunit gamma and tau [Georgenia sp. Z1344]|uniref:DNA polymerase III subunit gamma and tau n=1 Tax=Georgenia sp. Z1344 TaxID=3416706 RepID=UPI003CF06DB5